MNTERLKKQMDFICELDKMKEIYRQTYLCSGSRKENDAEHSFHLAIMAAILSEYSNEKVDVAKVMTMVLIHDVIEIDAGDTYAYDQEANKSKRERELKAAHRLFHLLPDDQAEYMRGLWDEFEENETAEAKFANSLDKIQPTLLNHTSHGKSWTEHQVTVSQILGRNERTKEGSCELWNYARDNYIMPHVAKNGQAGEILDDE